MLGNRTHCKQNGRRGKSSGSHFNSAVVAASYSQCHGVLLCYLLISRKRRQVAMLNVALEYNKALAGMRHVKRRIIRRRRFQRKPGRMDQWWRNLFEGRMEESEWKMMMAVCCQPSKRLETSETLSRVAELSPAERLQGN